MWDPLDIPPQRAAHAGQPVTYVADWEGKVAEKPVLSLHISNELAKELADMAADQPNMPIQVERNGAGERKYLPTLSDLVDRLTIVQLKAIFIPEHRSEYLKERDLIKHDIDIILGSLDQKVTADDFHAVAVIMLANRFIWENESKARNGGNEQDKLLKLTHSINGVRAQAKNELARLDGGRKDYKIDCFAASLVKEFGDWNVFEAETK